MKIPIIFHLLGLINIIRQKMTLFYNNAVFSVPLESRVKSPPETHLGR